MAKLPATNRKVSDDYFLLYNDEEMTSLKKKFAKGNTEESTYIFTYEYKKRLYMYQQPKFYNTYI